MSNETTFYILGGVLITAAVVLAAVGIRSERFPSRSLYAGLIVLFGALVVATSVFAWRSAEDEAHHRENEEAAELEQEQAEIKGEEETDDPEGAAPPAPTGKEAALKVSSPPDGALVFDPGALEAPAGEVAIEYMNPSRVEHDLVLEKDGEVVAKTDLIANGADEVMAQLEPGEYPFFCDVPGHREGGMEGTLTVK